MAGGCFPSKAPDFLSTESKLSAASLDIVVTTPTGSLEAGFNKDALSSIPPLRFVICDAYSGSFSALLKAAAVLSSITSSPVSDISSSGISITIMAACSAASILSCSCCCFVGFIVF
jgi:hypothetical protein